MHTRRISTAVRYGIAACAAIVVAVGLTAAQSGVARAQSPSFGNRFSDYAPGGTVPTTVGKVVEALGLGSCGPYSLLSVEESTVSDINHGYVTATEISPQSYCGDQSQYEAWISDLVSYVEKNSSNPGNYWAGVMLDEEGGWFTAAAYENINNYTGNTAMVSTPGVSWYFTEDQPQAWDIVTYYDVISGSWPAPQIYNTSDEDTVNTACSRYDYLGCENLVTVDVYTGSGSLGAPWDEDSYATGVINGPAWQVDYWGDPHWVNNWVPS